MDLDVYTDYDNIMSSWIIIFERVISHIYLVVFSVLSASNDGVPIEAWRRRAPERKFPLWYK